MAAEAAYREALQLTPGFLQAHLNLGHQLEHQGRHDEALAAWDMVLKLAAQQGQAGQQVDLELPLHALNNTARLLEQLRRYDESEAAMKRSLLLQPDQSRVIQHLVHIRQKQCEWPVYAPVQQTRRRRPACPPWHWVPASCRDDGRRSYGPRLAYRS